MLSMTVLKHKGKLRQTYLGGAMFGRNLLKKSLKEQVNKSF